jgi:peptide/nickel transport system permease protein
VSTYVARRVLQALVVLLGVSIIVFGLLQLVPGDPVRVAMGTRFDPQVYEALRERSGLDQPLLQQYLTYLGHAVTGDLGVSFRSGEAVTSILLDRLPATASLAIAAVVIAILIAIPLGTLAAVRSGSVWDYAATGLSQIGVSVPDFWMGILFILLFTSTLGWLPPSGYEALFSDPVGWLEHVLMPAAAIGLVSGAILTRFVRGAVLESLRRDYTRTARSKGLPDRVIIRRHVLRGALVPIVTVTGLQLASLLGGVIVIEIVFAWPGLGQVVVDAVRTRDYPVVQGAVLLFAATFLIVNLIVDLLYAALDPRIRYS